MPLQATQRSEHSVSFGRQKRRSWGSTLAEGGFLSFPRFLILSRACLASCFITRNTACVQNNSKIWSHLTLTCTCVWASQVKGEGTPPLFQIVWMVQKSSIWVRKKPTHAVKGSRCHLLTVLHYVVPTYLLERSQCACSGRMMEHRLTITLNSMIPRLPSVFCTISRVTKPFQLSYTLSLHRAGLIAHSREKTKEKWA